MVSVTIKRLPCLAHTLQLVLKSIDKLKSYHNLILKARHLVRMVKSSSVATEKLMLKAGLTFINVRYVIARQDGTPAI